MNEIPSRQVSRKLPKRKGTSRPRSPSKLESRHMTSKQQTISKEGTKRKNLEEYQVTFYYHHPKGEKKQETVTVYARDLDDAVNHAMKRRKIDRKPTKTVVKDGLGDVVAKMARSAGRVVGTFKAVKREYDTGKIERTVKASQSNDKSTALVARQYLKKEYPHIYKQIAFEEV